MNNFSGGLNSDISIYNQVPNTYRYALNYCFESNEGDLTAITSESGNELKVELDKTIIGTQILPDEKILIFSTDNIESEIGIYNQVKENYEVLIKSTCLNFSTESPIRSLMRIRKGCERVIYFTDRRNPYRVINIDSLEQYLMDSYSTVEEANQNDAWNCNSFKLSTDYKIPNIDLISINDSGGSLKVGTIQFSVRYLDSDSNPSDFFYVTNPVPIVDESLGAEYAHIDGGFSAIDLNQEGAVPTTNKSVTIKISNIDRDQSFIQIAGLHTSAGTGAVSEVLYTDPIPINSDEIDFTYTGSSTYTNGDLSDIIIDTEKIDIVYAHAQYDSSLWLGGIYSKTKDFANYQRYASKIKVDFITKQVQVTDQTHPGDPKCPNTYWDTRSLMGDEVYAIGIVYIYKDGSYSPVFHIPGRPPIQDDFTNITASDNTAHLGEGDQPRWKVENTGYYQLDSYTYPNIKDCNGESIWGVDYEGNPLENTPIRHHRCPSRRDFPTYDNSTDSINIFGLRLSNVEYPDEDIIGHRFVISQRDLTNETVHDMGIIAPSIETPNEYQFKGYQYITSTNRFPGYWSPKMLYNRTIVPGNHIEVVSTVASSAQEYSQKTYGISGFFTAPKDFAVAKYSFHSPYLTPSIQHFKIEGQYILNNYSYKSADAQLPKKFTNYAVTNPLGLLVLKNTPNFDPDGEVVIFTFSSFYKEVYTDLTNIRYRSLHNNILTASNTTDTFDVFGGDVFVTYLNIHFSIPYETTFIDDLSVYLYNLTFWGALGTQGNLVARGEYLSGIWIESDINTALRHSDKSNDCTQYYQGGLSLVDYTAFKYIYEDPDNPDKYLIRDQPCTEYYAYNIDFSKKNIEKDYSPLQRTFDYCSECQKEFPYKLMASEVSYQEETVDTYKVFRPLNYTNLPGNTGPIQSLKVYQDKLFAITEEGIYYIPAKPETLQGSESTIYLGKGERFSIPPKRIISPDFQYAGTINDLSVVSTEYGIAYADSASSKIFFLGGKLEELSLKGLKYFFHKNLRLVLLDQLEKADIEYPLSNSPTHKFGTGIIAVYDSLRKRLIFTKKDYEYIGKPVLSNTNEVGTMNFVNNSFQLNTISGPIIVTFDNETYFRNRSFTISYSLTRGRWESFHSYLPNLYVGSHRTFYSILDTQLWEHNIDNKPQEFYNKVYESVLDFVEVSAPEVIKLKAVPTKYTSSVFYGISINNICLRDNIPIPNRTIDRLCVYNSSQISPITDVEVKKSLNPFATVITDNMVAERLDSEFEISRLRDFVIGLDGPIFSDRWEDIRDFYPIDKVPNPQVYDLNKTLYQRARLRDRYLGIRLYFTPKEQERLILTNVSSRTKKSY